VPKGYRSCQPEQDLPLPPSLRGWPTEGHPAYCVGDVVDELVYGHCVEVFSWRRIRKRLREEIGFKVLAAGNEPDFRTISDSRKIHLEALQGLFEQVPEMALESGAVKLGRVEG
jgi:hypothetical protein